MIQHLSNRVLCQKAMGIEVPHIHPPTLSLPLEPVHTAPKHKNRKHLSAPQLSHGLHPPPHSKLQKHAPSPKDGVAPTTKEMLSHLDSHDLKYLLLGQLADTDALFNIYMGVI